MIEACWKQFRRGTAYTAYRDFILSVDEDDFRSVLEFRHSCGQLELMKCDDHGTSYQGEILSLDTSTVEIHNLATVDSCIALHLYLESLPKCQQLGEVVADNRYSDHCRMQWLIFAQET